MARANCRFIFIQQVEASEKVVFHFRRTFENPTATTLRYPGKPLVESLNILVKFSPQVFKPLSLLLKSSALLKNSSTTQIYSKTRISKHFTIGSKVRFLESKSRLSKAYEVLIPSSSRFLSVIRGTFLERPFSCSPKDGPSDVCFYLCSRRNIFWIYQTWLIVSKRKHRRGKVFFEIRLSFLEDLSETISEKGKNFHCSRARILFWYLEEI